MKPLRLSEIFWLCICFLGVAAYASVLYTANTYLPPEGHHYECGGVFGCSFKCDLEGTPQEMTDYFPLLFFMAIPATICAIHLMFTLIPRFNKFLDEL